MSSGLAAITLSMPSITSGTIFSSRRANNGLNAENPFVAAMNLDIAGGQITNAAKGVTNIAKEYKNSFANGLVSAEQSIKNLAKGDKILRGCGKVLNFTANNINPLICATGGVNVLVADDKMDEAARQGLALSTMFGCEAGAKRVIGLPYTEKVNGKKMTFKREGLYKKNPFLEKQATALKDYCETTKVFNKSLKFAPACLKGLGFALASIFGYKLGDKVGNMMLGERKSA